MYMFIYMSLYVCKRTHDTGEIPSVGQPVFFKSKSKLLFQLDCLQALLNCQGAGQVVRK